MPRTGYFIAIATAIITAVVFPWPAGADHTPAQPFWTCSASTARVTLGDGDPIPPVDPLGANLEREECAEDQGGLPDISIPPDDPAPLIQTTTAQARTQIFCRPAPPNQFADIDPENPPQDDETCDAGVPSYQQRVLSTADVTDTTLRLGSGAQSLTIVVQAANTSARARCGPGNVPVIGSTSQVLGLSIGVGPTQTPFPVPLITGDPNQVIEIPGLVRITLNELLVDAPAGVTPNQAGDVVYPDSPGDATAEGQVTRRAIHVEIPAGEEPTRGSVADVVVAESIADFHGDVCPEGTVVVRKQTAPDESPNSTNFGFTATGGLTPATFTLQDDGERQFTEVAPDQQYTVAENAPPSPFSLSEIDCRDREGNTTTSLATRTATINVGPGETVTCTFTNVRPGPPPPGQVTCPDGTTQVGTRCVVNQSDCPPGTARNPQGQCIVTNVQCPAGTTFNPVTRGCSEAPRGGTLVPLNQRLLNLLRTSPCVGQGFGPLVAIFGTNGPDRITGTNTSDRVFALGGNDRVSGGRGDDCVEGGSGRDVLDGSNGNDFLLGGTGNDQVNGGPGRDRFSGGSGRDVMSGGTGNDRMTGGGGRDRLNGGYGNDRLVGGSGNDGIHTGNGRDRVNAGSGNDIINAATVGPPAFVDCGPGRKDRVRINRNERRRIRNCEFVDIPRRFRSNNREISPR